MKNRDTLQKLQESSEFRAMYREIIYTQIQTLIAHLAMAGDESVLLTACSHETDVTETNFVGTELGQDFLNQENLQCRFKEFCLVKKHVANEKMNLIQSSPTPDLKDNKRKFSDITDTLTEDSSEAEQMTPKKEYKRSRSLTPLKSVMSEDTAGTSMYIPKGHSKCSQCNYISKFKANVTRHERSVHRINVEGATLVTAQYTCALCEYKSTYRANLVRHEKSIHKVVSSNAEIESRKIQVVQNVDGSSFTDAVLGLYEKDNRNQLNKDQSFDSEMENIGNQSMEKIGEGHHSISHIPHNPDLSDVKIENQTVGSEGNQSDVKENGSNIDKQSSMHDCGDGEMNGCHICNYCQLIYTSKTELLQHIDSAHPKTSLLEHERAFNCETGLQNVLKQEVCKCGKAFQYRTSLQRHEKKCEYFIACQENKYQGDITVSFGNESESFCDQNETNLTVSEKEEIKNETV